MSDAAFFRRAFWCFCVSALLFSLSLSKVQSQEKTITLNELTSKELIQLKGVDGRASFLFSVPSVQQVETLVLNLNVRFSDALLSDLSHLAVFLNQELIDVISVPEQASRRRSYWYEVLLPTRFLESHNDLELQLIGHYTMGCEDPFHPSLWANIESDSYLAMTTNSLPLKNDLSHLPQPFLDPWAGRTQELPMVLSSTQPAVLEAAGTVASWFSLQANDSKLRFPILHSVLPDSGHAIVFQQAEEEISGLTLASLTKPQVQIINNPHDPQGKLLLIRGLNGDALKTAARSLALSAETFSGKQVDLEELQIRLRQPYDAPAWLPTNRPVKFAELLRLSPSNTVSGPIPEPITYAINLPPDLYDWRDKKVPLSFTARYSMQVNSQDPVLDLAINGQQLHRKTLPANRKQDSSRNKGVVTQTLSLPLANIGSRSVMEFDFNYPLPVSEECKSVVANIYRSEIDPESTIDFSGFPHYLEMPNLAAFATSGFPFSRLADLHETAIVFGPNATADDYSAYLSLMGHIARVTRYPVIQQTVLPVSAVKEAKDKDLLLLGQFDQLFSALQWEKHLPVIMKKFSDQTWLGAVSARLADMRLFGSRSLDSLAIGERLLIVGFQSPLNPKRSVVSLSSSNSAALLSGTQTLTEIPTVQAQVQGGVALVSADGAASWLVRDTYFVGSLGPWKEIRWLLGQNPLLLLLLLLAGILLFAMMLYAVLRARAQKRLNPDDH